MQKQSTYSGNFVYEDNKLAFILTDEGRLVPDSTGFTYEYFIKDHLGNTRVTVKDSLGFAAIQQEAHYYPFGLEISGLSFNKTQPKNKYLYNGKELQDDLGLGWYDYGARFYDAEVPHFTTIDPHAENYYSISPYAYVANNPINCIDPNGRDIYIRYQTQEEKKYKTGKRKGQIKIDRKGNAKYKTVTKYQKYEVGMSGIGNEFADNVISSLNLLNTVLDKIGGQFNSMISDIADNSNISLDINESSKLNGAFGASRKYGFDVAGGIKWNSQLGLVGDITQNGTNRMPPIVALFHEIAHSKFYFDAKLSGSKVPSQEYEHSLIIPDEADLGYGARKNYASYTAIYKANSPTSTLGKKYGGWKRIAFGYGIFVNNRRKFNKGK